MVGPDNCYRYADFLDEEVGAGNWLQWGNGQWADVDVDKRLCFGPSNLSGDNGPSGLLSKQSLRMPRWDTPWLRSFLTTFYHGSGDLDPSHFNIAYYN